LKNSEVKDEFNAKGLKQAGEVLDFMRLNEDDQYSYNRYMEYLSYKASEVFTLKSEAEDKIKEAERLKNQIEFAEKLILKGFDNLAITELTGLTSDKTEEVRAKLIKK
jgi:hypothetical protein